MPDSIRGVLFDFAGTLLAPEDELRWLRAVLARHEIRVDDAQARELAARLTRAGRPGPVLPTAVPPEHAELFARRDLSSDLHRAAYTQLMGAVALPPPVTVEELYERSFEPAAWVPYSDAKATLRALHDTGVGVAVVSNVGFDLRPIFAHHRLERFVKAFVLSYEVGVDKPRPAIFELACERLGVPPRAALMVGDHAGADGAAVDAGIRTLLLPASPPGAEQGLSIVLSLVRSSA